MIGRADLFRLILLSAIWGGSFIFMRIIAPVLGPVVTAFFRVGIGGLALVIYFWITGFDIEWKKQWKHYAVVGILNCAVPYSLFAFAAIHLPASLSAILNSSSPIFAAIFGAFILHDRFTVNRVIGLILGSAGVALVALKGSETMTNIILYATLSCLFASACYGLVGVYIKRYAKDVKPFGFAAASQIFAALSLLPLLPFSPIRGEPNALVIGNLLGLALLSSAVAFILYFKLINNVGPTKALTVTYLMPLFGVLWAVLFLGEQVTMQMLFGGLLIVGGTALVLRKQ